MSYTLIATHFFQDRNNFYMTRIKIWKNALLLQVKEIQLPPSYKKKNPNHENGHITPLNYNIMSVSIQSNKIKTWNLDER